MSDLPYTTDEILLAADRFRIDLTKQGSTMRLADDFMAKGQHLSSIQDCLGLTRKSLERGHKVNIEVPHGTVRIPSTPST